MNKKQTKDFMHFWNEANGFPDGLTPEANMRYRKDGVVFWNEYDSPEVDVEQFIDCFNKVKK